MKSKWQESTRSSCLLAVGDLADQTQIRLVAERTTLTETFLDSFHLHTTDTSDSHYACRHSTKRKWLPFPLLRSSDSRPNNLGLRFSQRRRIHSFSPKLPAMELYLSGSQRAAIAGLFVLLLPVFVPNLFGPLGRASPSMFSVRQSDYLFCLTSVSL